MNMKCVLDCVLPHFSPSSNNMGKQVERIVTAQSAGATSKTATDLVRGHSQSMPELWRWYLCIPSGPRFKDAVSSMYLRIWKYFLCNPRRMHMCLLYNHIHVYINLCLPVYLSVCLQVDMHIHWATGCWSANLCEPRLAFTGKESYCPADVGPELSPAPAKPAAQLTGDLSTTTERLVGYTLRDL